MARDFRNTLGYMDLLARERFQQNQMMNDQRIAAEQRQAQYQGVNQLLQGVGREQERVRAGNIAKARAGGLSAAIDDGEAPGDTGDVEADAAAQEAYQGHRAKAAATAAANQAVLNRLLATYAAKRPHEQAMEEVATDRAANSANRTIEKEQHDKQLTELQRQRDEATRKYKEVLADAARRRAGAAQTSAGTGRMNAQRNAIKNTSLKPRTVRMPDGSTKLVYPSPQEVANDRAIRETQAGAAGMSLPPESDISGVSPGQGPAAGGTSDGGAGGVDYDALYREMFQQ